MQHSPGLAKCCWGIMRYLRWRCAFGYMRRLCTMAAAPGVTKEVSGKSSEIIWWPWYSPRYEKHEIRRWWHCLAPPEMLEVKIQCPDDPRRHFVGKIAQEDKDFTCLSLSLLNCCHSTNIARRKNNVFRCEFWTQLVWFLRKVVEAQPKREELEQTTPEVDPD